MKLGKRITLVATAVLLCGCALVIFFILSYRIPSDSTLSANFESHKNAFIELRGMLLDEPSEILGIAGNEIILKRSSIRVSREEAGIDPPRFFKYREIMKSNDIKQFFRYEDEVLFLCGFSGWGFAGKGPRFAYVYRSTSPEPLLDSLDNFSKTTSAMQVAYRPLGQDWYMRLVW